VYNNVSETKRRYASSQESFVKQTRTAAPMDAKPKAAVVSLSVGDRVEHVMFGVGVIRAASDMGGDALYEIEFEKVGTKKLMASFAKLKKV